MFDAGDERWMRRAIDLAQRGSGMVSPNPMVGAVLVHEGRIIGEGWHHQYGDVHAEVDCLNNIAAGDKSLIPQSTMYVTLEPCAHQGKQPPCAHRLVDEGIRKVVVAIEDPFAPVRGRGIAILKEAGVEVTIGCCSPEARWMSRRFLQAQEAGRPYVVLKWAQSADGFFAPADGSRKQLSNHFSQVLVHKWRTEESAILVGYNTALTDNPQLTARYWQGAQPLRIVLDKHLALPRTHHVFDETASTWVINEHEEMVNGSTTYLKMPFTDSLLPALLQKLREAGKNSLLVEGGAKTLNAFIKAGLWDEARIFEAPVMLGEGIPAPLLRNAKQVSETFSGNDRLRIFLLAAGTFSYPANAAG